MTGRPRRVAQFHPEVVERAVRTNRPNLVILNHADYFVYSVHETQKVSDCIEDSIARIESTLACRIDYIGTGPSTLVRRTAGGIETLPNESNLVGSSAALPAIHLSVIR